MKPNFIQLYHKYYFCLPVASEVSTGNPGFFREFFIEKFITENAQGNFQPEGPGGGKGEPGVPPKLLGGRQ